MNYLLHNKYLLFSLPLILFFVYLENSFTLKEKLSKGFNEKKSIECRFDLFKKETFTFKEYYIIKDFIYIKRKYIYVDKPPFKSFNDSLYSNITFDKCKIILVG